MRFRFDDCELDGDRLVLYRGGKVERAEPRVLELLVYLLEHRERLVTKEELNEELWSGRAVTDAALTRCLYQARKALGDSSGQQRYLCTVHGRGVRFAEGIEVEELTGNPADDEAAALPEEVPSLRPAARQGEEPASVARGRWRVAALVLLTVGVALASGVAARWQPSSPLSTAVPMTELEPKKVARGAWEEAGEMPKLAILPLARSDASGTPAGEELELLGLSLVDLLHTRLSLVPGLVLRPLVLSEEVAATAGSVQEMAERIGATHVLAGSVMESAQQRAQVTLDLYELVPDRPVRITPLGSFGLPGLGTGEDFGEFLRVRDAIASRAVRLIGSAFVLSETEPGGTRNAEAWRLYVLGYQRLQGDYCGGSGAARELFERALEIDPDFGLAWEALGTAFYNRVWACGESADLFDAAMNALGQALVVAPALRVPRFSRITMLLETGQVEEAFAAVEEQLSLYPDEPLGLNAQSYALRFAGFLKPSATALDRLLELDPLAFAVGSFGGSPNTYLYQGRLDRFLTALPVSDMVYFRWYRGFASYLQGSEGEAREILEPAFRSSPSEIFGRLAHALLAILDGDPDSARAIVREISRQRRELGGIDAEITYKQAQLCALAGHLDDAFDELRRTIAQGFFCVSCFELDPVLEELRGDPRWGGVIAVARKRHLAFARRFGLEPEIL